MIHTSMGQTDEKQLMCPYCNRWMFAHWPPDWDWQRCTNDLCVNFGITIYAVPRQLEIEENIKRNKDRWAREREAELEREDRAFYRPDEPYDDDLTDVLRRA